MIGLDGYRFQSAILSGCKEIYIDFAHILKISYKKAFSGLENTPYQLDVLRKNNVVDAGGSSLAFSIG